MSSFDIAPGEGVAVFRLPVPMNAFELVTDAIERIYGTGESMLTFNGNQIQVNAPADGFGPLKTGRRATPTKVSGDMKTSYLKARDEKLEVTLEDAQDKVAALMGTTRLWFDAMGGINYVEFGLQAPDGEPQPFVYCVQRRDGETPHGKREAAEKRLYDVQAYLAKTLDNIEGGDYGWTGAEAQEFIAEALAMTLPPEALDPESEPDNAVTGSTN
jgi:hypothetical protein